MINIEILDGSEVKRSLQFGADPSAHVIKIGRVASPDIRFEYDDQVARLHAMIARNHDGVFVIDSGDVISVGRQKLRLTFVIDPGN